MGDVFLCSRTWETVWCNSMMSEIWSLVGQTFEWIKLLGSGFTMLLFKRLLCSGLHFQKKPKLCSRQAKQKVFRQAPKLSHRHSRLSSNISTFHRQLEFFSSLSLSAMTDEFLTIDEEVKTNTTLSYSCAWVFNYLLWSLKCFYCTCKRIPYCSFDQI